MCHNRRMDERPVNFRKSTRRHRIGRVHAIYVMNNYPPVFETRDRRYWLDRDARGRLLEVIAIFEAHQITVIHVMPYALRKKGNDDG